MLKAIDKNFDETINRIELIIGPISPSGSLFGPKLHNCIHATAHCLYYKQQNPKTTKNLLVLQDANY